MAHAVIRSWTASRACSLRMSGRKENRMSPTWSSRSTRIRRFPITTTLTTGVLHHTSDPEGGFHSIARKVKPGGYVIIGLYNWLGRLPTLWRRKVIETFGERWAMLDSRLRSGALNTGRRSAWFMDQYRHP